MWAEDPWLTVSMFFRGARCCLITILPVDLLMRNCALQLSGGEGGKKLPGYPEFMVSVAEETAVFYCGFHARTLHFCCVRLHMFLIHVVVIQIPKLTPSSSCSSGSLGYKPLASTLPFFLSLSLPFYPLIHTFLKRFNVLRENIFLLNQSACLTPHCIVSMENVI